MFSLFGSDEMIPSSRYSEPREGEGDYRAARAEAQDALRAAIDEQRRRTCGTAGRSTRRGYIPPVPGREPCPELQARIDALAAALAAAHEWTYAAEGGLTVATAHLRVVLGGSK